MPYYKICDKCGATLDPGERCSCEKDKAREQAAKEIEKKVKATMVLALTGKRRKHRG